MKIYSLSVPALCLLLISVGCNKTKDDAATPSGLTGEFTFFNNLGEESSFDIYPTQDDYYRNSNIIYHGKVSANSKQTLAMTTFEKDKTYYVDWYTNDYQTSNWINDNMKETVYYTTVLNPTKSSSYTIGHIGDKTLFRDHLLSKTKSETLWKSPSGEIEVVFKKNFKLKVTESGYPIREHNYYCYVDGGLLKIQGESDFFGLIVGSTLYLTYMANNAFDNNNFALSKQ